MYTITQKNHRKLLYLQKYKKLLFGVKKNMIHASDKNERKEMLL